MLRLPLRRCTLIQTRERSDEQPEFRSEGTADERGPGLQHHGCAGVSCGITGRSLSECRASCDSLGSTAPRSAWRMPTPWRRCLSEAARPVFGFTSTSSSRNFPSRSSRPGSRGPTPSTCCSGGDRTASPARSPTWTCGSAAARSCASTPRTGASPRWTARGVHPGRCAEPARVRAQHERRARHDHRRLMSRVPMTSKALVMPAA